MVTGASNFTGMRADELMEAGDMGGRAGASRPGPPKDEARRFQRVFQFEFHCRNL